MALSRPSRACYWHLIVRLTPEESPLPADPPTALFIGRVSERAAAQAVLDSDAGLLTLLGPAGMGKTRLARELATWAAEHLPGGMVFCSLDDAWSLVDVAARLAAASGVPAVGHDSPESLVRAVAAALVRRGAALLVLDNAEQALEPIALAVGLSRAAGPALRCLVTSRIPLGVAGEQVHRLPPLALPDEAAALFLHHARRVRPGFEPTPELRETIDEIVARLEGLPLAIELAASRMGVLGPREIRDRLGEPLQLLSDPRGDHPARHVSLDAAMRWSWALLTESLRAAFAQCSIFRGGFEPAAAEAVITDVPDPLDALAELVDRSLLQRQTRPDGGVRLSMYEAIRAFAAARLAEHPARAEGVAARHAAYYAGQGAKPRVLASRNVPALESDNLQAAFRWSVKRPEWSLPLALALDPAQTGIGQLREHAERLERALNDAADVPDGAGAAAVRARVALGNTWRALGRVHEATVCLEAAAVAGAATPEAPLALHEWGVALHHLGRGDAAEARFREALALAEALGQTVQAARARGSLAVMRHEAGALDEAAVLYLSAVDTLRHAGEPRALAVCLTNLGDLHKERGAFELARPVFAEARAQALLAGDTRIAAVLTGNLGGIAEELDQTDEALALRTEALETLTTLGDTRTAAIFAGLLGRLHERGGDFEAARTSFRDAAFRLAAAGERRHEALCRAALSAAAARAGHRAEAESEGALAKTLAESLADPNVRLAVALHLARAHFGSTGRRDDAERALAGCEAGARAASDEVRLAHEALARALSPTGVARLAPLVVLPGARAFRLGTAEAVELTRRIPLRRMLARLVEARLESPGRPLDLDALLAAGWPGERVLPDAAANRVYVNLAALRGLGLRPYLQNPPGGWCLDPAAPVRWGADEI